METDKPPVTIYTSPTCVFCHMAMEYFKDHGIEYTEKDITNDKDALNYVIDTVGQAVTPIITVGKEVIVGFDRPKLEAALIPSQSRS